MVSASDITATEDSGNPQLQHQPKARRKSLRRLSQAVFDKLSSSAAIDSNPLDADYLSFEIHRRLTYRGTGFRRMSILSQSGSYKLGPGSSSKCENLVKQVTLSNKRKFQSEEELDSVTSQSTLENTSTENPPDKASLPNKKLQKVPRTVTKDVTLQTRKRAQPASALKRSSSTSSRKSVSKAGVVRKTSSKSKGSQAAKSNSGKMFRKRDKIRQNAVLLKAVTLEEKTPIDTHPKMDTNLTIKKKIFPPNSTTKKPNKAAKIVNKPQLKSEQIQSEDEDDRTRRMSFDEYQLLEHKKKLEKQLIFKTYREKRAEFIQSDKDTCG